MCLLDFLIFNFVSWLMQVLTTKPTTTYPDEQTNAWTNLHRNSENISDSLNTRFHAESTVAVRAGHLCWSCHTERTCSGPVEYIIGWSLVGIHLLIRSHPRRVVVCHVVQTGIKRHSVRIAELRTPELALKGGHTCNRVIPQICRIIRIRRIVELLSVERGEGLTFQWI